VLEVSSVYLLRVGKNELTNELVNMLQRKAVTVVEYDVLLSQLSDVVCTNNSLDTILELHSMAHEAVVSSRLRVDELLKPVICITGLHDSHVFASVPKECSLIPIVGGLQVLGSPITLSCEKIFRYS
tara:strand:+ start:1578 stop:1958 length:381 start_codon:yes stop_codon:yes gene_type:complete